MSEAKDKREALEEASMLAFDDIEGAMLGVVIPEQAATPASGKAADIDPNDAIQRALAKNSNGSFERLRGMVGGLDQRGKMI